MATGTYISIITLNVNGLSVPTKRQTGWMDTKTRPVYMLSTRDPIKPKDTYRLKMRMEKYIPCKWEAKESWSIILISKT